MGLILSLVFKITWAAISFPIYHYKLFGIHCLISFLLSTYIYFKLYPFYSPKNEIFHKEYYYFRRLDKLNFLRLLLGCIFLVIPRILLMVLSVAGIAITVSFGKNILDPKYKFWKDWIYKKLSRVILFSLGCVIPNELRLSPEFVLKIYRKYLGPDYQISYDEKFGSIICNHVSWVESFFFSYKYVCGFVAKKSSSKVPGISHMGKYNQAIYCDRQNEEDKKLTAQKIIDRQKMLMNGTSSKQLTVYPEGTMTNGTHLIKFKRGVFMSLFPIKPYLEMIDQSGEFSLAVGPLPMHWHMMLACCYLWNNVTFYDLPIIKPTEFMYEKYKDLGSEKWMIYMNVCKMIMAECGNFKTCEATFKPEKLDYLSKIKGKLIKNT